MPQKDSYKGIGNRMRTAREMAGKSQHDVAEYLGVEDSTYTRYELGKLRISIPDLQRVASFLNVGLDDLLTERPGGMRQRTPSEIARELLASLERPQPIAVRKVESLAAAGEGAIAEGEIITYYPQPHEVGHRFLAIDVKGTCMEPVIRDGETVTVDLDASPRYNDIVAVYHEGESLIRILRDRFLYSMNGHPPIEMNENTRIVGVVVYVGRRPKVPF